MPEELFEKKAGFISWCIEVYAAKKSLNGRDVAKESSKFWQKGWVYIYQMLQFFYTLLTSLPKINIVYTTFADVI